MTQGKYVWADWSAHLAYSGHFAWRPIGDWFESHPLFYGAGFTYPFAMDGLSGILIKLGMNEAGSFVVPSILTTFYLLFILWLFYNSFLRSGVWSFLAVTLFLAGGSMLLLWYYLPEFIRNSARLPLDYEQVIPWKNIIVSEILPQRAFLLGMPWMLTIIYFLLRLREQAKHWHIGLLGAASAALLVIHVHSFITLAIFGVVLFAMHWWQWRQIISYGLATGLFALPIYLWMFHGDLATESFIRWHGGWMAFSSTDLVPGIANTHLHNSMQWIFFWLFNWSIFLPLAAFTTWSTKLYRHPIVVAGFVIFAIANLVMFQPWEWDNTKILTWSYLFLIVPIVAWFQQIWNQIPRAIAAAIITLCVGLLTLGGALEIGIHTGHVAESRLRLVETARADQVNPQRTEHTIYSQADYEIAKSFREISEPTDVVLTADRVNNWITGLTGRNILLGYRGWMWTYGLDDAGRYTDMLAIYAGTEKTPELLEKYGVDYVMIGGQELNDYRANEQYFAENYSAVIDTNQYRIYEISNP